MNHPGRGPNEVPTPPWGGIAATADQDAIEESRDGPGEEATMKAVTWHGRRDVRVEEVP
jgi:hypothetical protein